MLFVRNSLSLLSKAPKTTPSIWMIGTSSSRRAFSSKPSPAHQRMLKRNTASSTISDVPTLEEVEDMPLTFKRLDNASLVQLAAMENHEARIEVLKRHIMGVDNVSYDVACTKFDEIADYNDKGLVLMALPYYLAISMSVTAALASFPLVFDITSVHYFNEAFVTTDVPEPQDLETMFEVGSWSWNWMEPPLGQISFVLLCLQHARAQMHNLGLKPYTRFLKQKRAERLARQYPQYNERVIMSYSKSDNFMLFSK